MVVESPGTPGIPSLAREGPATVEVVNVDVEANTERQRLVGSLRSGSGEASSRRRRGDDEGFWQRVFPGLCGGMQHYS
jgi:hypothetical protein